MKFLSFFFLTVFISFSSQAKIFLISDIDDTIKISEVLDFKKSLINAVKTDEDNAFKGMARLYQSLRDSHPALEFYYVSNAPRSLMLYFHREFLRKNSFPSGFLALNPQMGGSHKIPIIQKILSSAQGGDEVVLIGDDGEKDSEVYAFLADHYPHLLFHQFIRVNYGPHKGHALLKNQKAFISSADLALHFYEKQLLNWGKALEQVENGLELPRYKKWVGTHPLELPAWVDCRSYEAPSHWSQWSAPSVQRLLAAMASRCSVETSLAVSKLEN